MSYSPTIGRFMQQDPEEYVEGPNLYQFVSSNPVNYVDPFGTDSVPSQVAQMGMVVGPIDALDATGHSIPGTTAYDAFAYGREMEAKFNKNGCFKPGELANAFRHTYWQAMLTGMHGVNKSEQLGNIHEHNAVDQNDSTADQRNNVTGRKIGGRASSQADLRNMIETAFLKGEMYGWGADSRRLLDPTDCTKGCSGSSANNESSSSDSTRNGSGSYDSSSK